MAQKKDTAKRKKSRARRGAKRAERMERRFASVRSSKAMGTMAGSIMGGLAVGAGAYGQWISGTHVATAPWILAGGAVVLAAVVLWGDMEGVAVRVGDAGVALDKQGRADRRVAWCDMRKVRLKDGTIQIEADEGISFPVSANPTAAAWVIREAQERIPKRLEIATAQREQLVKTSKEDGERLKVEGLQVAGRACRASNKTITFEGDARYCPRCGEVYHKDSMPDSCLSCEAEITSR